MRFTQKGVWLCAPKRAREEGGGGQQIGVLLCHVYRKSGNLCDQRLRFQSATKFGYHENYLTPSQERDRESRRERDVERDANWNRVTAPASATASGRSPSPASLPRRVSNFLAPGLGTVLCSLVWFGLVRCSTLIKEHHKSVARAIVIMNLISIRALILILQVLHYRCVCVCGLVWPFVCPMFLVIEFICIILSAQQHRIQIRIGIRNRVQYRFGPLGHVPLVESGLFLDMCKHLYCRRWHR